MKLHQALDIMLRNGGTRGKEVLYKVDRLVAAAYQNKMSVRGRHVVWLIKDSFKSFDETDTTFGFEHLAKVTLHPNERTGDLVAFLKAWDWVLNSLHGVAHQETLIHQQFYRCIVKHQDLKFHMDCYHMRPKGHPDKCYRHLRKCVDDVIFASAALRNADERETYFWTNN